jgi:hypothetical protein
VASRARGTCILLFSRATTTNARDREMGCYMESASSHGPVKKTYRRPILFLTGDRPGIAKLDSL